MSIKKILLSGMIIGLSACGQSGKLYLPEPEVVVIKDKPPTAQKPPELEIKPEPAEQP